MAFMLAVLTFSFAAGDAPAGAEANPLRLRADRLTLDIESGNGTIARIEDATSGVVLVPPPGTAENFRLVLLAPDKTTSTILGKDQRLSSSHRDGDKLSLSWGAPLKDTTGAEHDIIARMTIAAAGDALTFTFKVENRAREKVREAWYPLVGGLTKFAARGAKPDASLWIPTSTPWEKSIAPPFANAAFGYPGQMNMSFSCIQSATAGTSIYFASHDTVARYKVYHFMEVASSGEKDVVACVQHLPFAPTGATFEGSPVVLRFVDGGWRAAANVYRTWFSETFGVAKLSDDWIRRQSFFLMTMFMLPEGTITFTFKDIPRWAKSAKECGINAVQISGWQMGGHDNGYPHYTIDPRLGTWQELADGIRQCHQMGLKVYFFVNYQPMMVTSDWYKNELSKYREMTADGGHTWMAGWGMGTLWARMGHPKLMTWADLAFPQFRKSIVEQFSKLAQIGGDGVHVDKMFPTALDYNPDIPLSPDTATWQGAILLTQEVMRECRKHNPDWAMSFECNWDRMLEFGGATWWVGNQLITRRVFPEHAETLGLYQAYDYLGVNNSVRNGHIVMVAPLNFCRSLDWPPFRGLADYIARVKRIRDSLADAVFYGEILDQNQVTLAGAPQAGIQYTVFRNRGNGLRVCILTNSTMDARELMFSAFAGPSSGRVRIHTPEREARVAELPAAIAIPGERIVFIEERGGER